MSANHGRVVAVCVGEPSPLYAVGKMRTTAIVKLPVAGPVPVGMHGMAGDVQVDKRHHGGICRAVYAYAAEDYAWWSDELDGRQLGPGYFGDNLTLEGIDMTNAVLGERWRVGSTVLRVTFPRIPCSTFAARMDDKHFVKKFAAAERFGPYLAVDEPGYVAAGDSAEIISRPDTSVTVAETGRIYLFEPERMRELLIPELSPTWTMVVRERLRTARAS
jgi:MOSC domain-containing protein YiiM